MSPADQGEVPVVVEMEILECRRSVYISLARVSNEMYKQFEDSSLSQSGSDGIRCGDAGGWCPQFVYLLRGMSDADADVDRTRRPITTFV